MSKHVPMGDPVSMGFVVCSDAVILPWISRRSPIGRLWEYRSALSNERLILHETVCSAPKASMEVSSESH